MTEVIEGEMGPFLAHRLRSALNKNEKILCHWLRDHPCCSLDIEASFYSLKRHHFSLYPK